jgi:hypothetical protein
MKKFIVLLFLYSLILVSCNKLNSRCEVCSDLFFDIKSNVSSNKIIEKYYLKGFEDKYLIYDSLFLKEIKPLLNKGVSYECINSNDSINIIKFNNNKIFYFLFSGNRIKANFPLTKGNKIIGWM